MSLETADFISQLIQTNPDGNDPKSRGDDHLRLVKHVLQTQFPGFTTAEPMTKTIAELNSSLIPGSFGVGGDAVAFTDANAIPFKTGFYQYTGTPGGGNLPPNALVSDTVIMHCPNPSAATQLYINISTAQLWTRRFNFGWLAWQPYAIGPKQLSPSDATAGAVLALGAFGLGHTLALGGISDLNSLVRTGWYAAINTTANTPIAGNFFTVLHMAHDGAGTMTQVAFPVGASAPGIFIRNRQNNGTWSGWGTPIGGAVQGWQQLTGSRLINTDYTNNTPSPIQVVVGGQTSGTNGGASLTINATVVGLCTWANFTVGNYPWSLSAIVPVGGVYRVAGQGTISNWAELR